MKAIFLSLLLAAFSSTALADWVAINKSKDFFYYPTSLKTQGKYVRVWGMVNYEEPSQNAYPKSKKMFLECDCHEGQVKTLAFSFYSEKMGKGDVLAENNYATGPWRWVQPNTLDEALFNLSCKPNQNQAPDSGNNSAQDTLDDEEEIVDEPNN